MDQKRVFLLCFFLIRTYFSGAQIRFIDIFHFVDDSNRLVKAYQLNPETEKSDIITAKLRPNLNFNQQSLFNTNIRDVQRIKNGETMLLSPYSRQTWFQLTKQLQIRGKRQAQIDYQQKQYEVSAKDADEFVYNIKYQAASKWLDVWYSNLLFENIQGALKVIDSIVHINSLRLKNKAISHVEYTRTEILSKQYKTQFASLNQQYKSERQKLSLLLGRNDTINIDTSGFFQYEPVHISLRNKDSLISIAYEKRKDLQTDIYATRATASNINLNKKLALQNPEFGFVYNPQNFTPYAGWYFEMPLPVFDRNQGNIQRSKVEYEQSLRQVDATKSRIPVEINYALQEYFVNRSNAEKFSDILNNADNILKTIRYSYLRGGTDLVDYLQAEQTWIDAQNDYDEAQYLYRKSHIDLLFLLGLLE